MRVTGSSSNAGIAGRTMPRSCGRCAATGPEAGSAGATIIALTASGYCCALSSGEMLQLQKRRLVKMMQRGLQKGKSLQEVIEELDH